MQGEGKWRRKLKTYERAHNIRVKLLSSQQKGHVKGDQLNRKIENKGGGMHNELKLENLRLRQLRSKGSMGI